MRHLKKTLLWVLVCTMLLSVVACTNPNSNPADTTGMVSDTESMTESGTETDSETESETETRPEINLPTDPAEIVALIDSISGGNLENEDKIDLAYAAWAALSEEDRALVTNYDTLRTRLQELADAYVVKEYSDSRIPHGQLVIGVYYAHDNADQMSDAHMQDLVDAHVNMAWGPSSVTTEFLDMFSKYNMGVFVSAGKVGVPVWRAAWAGEGYSSIPGDAYVPASVVASIVGDMPNDHPAIWGLDLTDEPNSNNFWWFEQTLPVMQEAYDVQVFSNMHPSYGGPGPLGTYSYLKYVRNYAERVDSELFSYDFYVYAHYLNPDNQNKNYTWASFLDDLSIQSEACADTGNDLVVIMQLNQAPWQNQSVTLEQLKYQAYASMAFGNKYVVWANYARNWGGWGDDAWHDGALDENGNKTQQYYRMKDCNADLAVLSPIYMRYTVKEQTMLNADPTTSSIPSFGIDHPLDELGQKTITDLKVAENKDVLVGYYEKNIGEGEAFMFVNSADILFSEPVTTTVSFRTVSGASIVTAYVKGVPTILDPVDGVYTIEVKDADAVFVTVTEPESINAKPAPAAPIGQLTIAGTDISEFVVVIPNDATTRETQAAEALVALIEKATGKTLTVVTDGTTDHAHYIYLGLNTTEALKADGYLIKTDERDLYITGNDAEGAGTLFGVYGFAEDYLGYRFYMADQVIVTPAEKVDVPAGLNEISNPAFAYREATFHAGVVQPYPLYQKYNGDLMYGDLGYACEWWAGETLFCMAGLTITDTVCLSDENVYATVLKNARHLMACDPDSEFLSCAVSQYTDWKDCPCEDCVAMTAAEGSPMALLLNFVNRLASDLAVDYPNVKVETLAVKDLLVVPETVRPADNVVVRVFLPVEICRFHALNDATCSKNVELCAAVEAWTAVCDNVMVLNNEVKREEALVTGANLLTLYDTIQYLKDMGVMGYTNTGHDPRSGELGELRNYLMSRLLWDGDMTYEEYLAEMDAFLKVYYGEGWTYIRQYIDKIGATEGIKHSDYRYNNTCTIYRIKDKDTTFMNECIALFDAAAKAATTSEHAYNAERSKLHIYKTCMEEVRDKNLLNTLKEIGTKYGFNV